MKLKSNAGALKKSPAKKSVGVNTTTKKTAISDLAKQIADIDVEINLRAKQIDSIKQEMEALYQKRLELAIYPYKLGDTVISEVCVGKTRKKQKCVLEMGEGGLLYLRPYKNDGELSGRRFSLIPTTGNYSDYLEKA